MCRQLCFKSNTNPLVCVDKSIRTLLVKIHMFLKLPKCFIVIYELKQT